MFDAIPAMYMRGGTSKGVYFLAGDLPQDSTDRDRVLLGVMGSPDPRQIDGMGGADPLTSKVAVVSRSTRPGVDVDYLFLQVYVDQDIAYFPGIEAHVYDAGHAFANDARPAHVPEAADLAHARTEAFLKRTIG